MKKQTVDVDKDRDEALSKVAAQFKALGDPTRLRIITYLARKERDQADYADDEPASNVTIADVRSGVFDEKEAPTTLSHHLKELRTAGLIVMERRGKTRICRVRRGAIGALLAYLPKIAP